MTTVVHEPEAFRTACEGARANGLRVGLVPTMGALHEGHLSLARAAADAGATFRVATIFVNPLQFAPTEDLDKYPRTLDADVAALAQEGVDLVFAPAPDAMYPPGFQTHVEVEALTKPHEGAFRPDHFRGVTTVVTKLFVLTGPCVAVFGRKDYQQWKVLERMTRDLGLPVEIVGRPTVREPDGLALSSRNRYLSTEDRKRALAIAEGLRAADAAWRAGERDPAHLEGLARAPIAARFDRIDYVATVDPETLAPLASDAHRALVLVAAHVGGTRLIDNLRLGEDPTP